MLWVDNIFVSIQGESSYVGFPTVFVRLFGCPVGCAYCDTFQKTKNKMSLGRIVDTVRSYKGIKYVCITGGEPLIQEDTMPLVYELQGLGYNVSIETSGCVPLDEESYRHSYKYVIVYARLHYHSTPINLCTWKLNLQLMLSSITQSTRIFPITGFMSIPNIGLTRICACVGYFLSTFFMNS